MTIEKYDLLNTMLNNTISPLRNNDGYIKLCEAHCVGLGKIQDTIDYMSDCLNIDVASGVWLDNIGYLVGVDRAAFDISRYFCVNSPDINVEKEFYFPKSSQWTKGSLNDILFRQRIRAKIGYNISNGTRENNLAIIKGLSNAEKVVITHAKEYSSTPFVVIGAPAISLDGIANGFAKNNAISTTIGKTPIKNIKIKGRFLWSDTNNSKDSICVPYVLGFNRYRIDVKQNSIYATSDLDASVGNRFNITLDEPLDNNDIIDIEDEIGADYRTFKATINGKVYEQHVDFLEPQSWGNINYLTLGNASVDGTSDYYWCGQIDLKENVVYVDDKQVYNGSKVLPMTLNVHLWGEDIIFSSVNSLRSDIENVLGVTVGLDKLEIN